MKTGWRARGIHWLLILGIWFQSLGPAFAHPSPAAGLEGLQFFACTPAGMVAMDLPAGDPDPDPASLHRSGHCPLCATTPALPALAGSGAVLPAAPWAQPLLPAAAPMAGAHRITAWTRPPVRSPPHRCR